MNDPVNSRIKELFDNEMEGTIIKHSEINRLFTDNEFNDQLDLELQRKKTDFWFRFAKWFSN